LDETKLSLLSLKIDLFFTFILIEIKFELKEKKSALIIYINSIIIYLFQIWPFII